MDTSKIGIRYSKALFALAEEKGLLNETRKDVDLVFSSIREIGDINLFLNSPVVKESKKRKFIEQIFKGKVSDYVLKFLDLIVKNKREQHIEDICRDFIDYYKEYKGIKSAVITTAFNLDKKLRDEIYNEIKKELKADVELIERVNENIVGGFILQIDGIQYDASIANKLNHIKREMIETNLKQIQ